MHYNYSNLTTLLTTTKNPTHIPQLHAHLLTSNLLPHPLLHTQLINLYARHCHVTLALLLFHSIKHHSNIITWTSLISHLSRSRLPLHSLSLFSLLHRSATLRPNPFTFSAVLPSCSAASAGDQIHALARKHGAAPSDLFVGSALADMYAKSADMVSSRKLFDEMPTRNLVSWNSIIVGYVTNKLYRDAIATFEQLLIESSVRPDQVSFSSVLSACANTGALRFGARVHSRAVKLGLESLAYVNNSLVDMYTKCGQFELAVELFDRAEDRDVVTWNIMMMGRVQIDRCEEAVKCFRDMRMEGVSPDEASFSTALHASSILATWRQGAAVHTQIIKSGFSRHWCIGSSLITMYAKCGGLEDAHRAFGEARDQLNVVSWTAMIAGFQQHGRGDCVLRLFDEMLELGIEPDYITFVCVLSACSHNGLIEEGFQYFDSMSRVHKMAPKSEHYACIVDMLGRAGRLDEGKWFIDTMTIKPDASVWGALLGACRNRGNLEMGKEVAERLFEIEPDNPGNYVLLSKMYDRDGRLEEAEEVRRLMGCNGVRKETGCSWIEVKNKTLVFAVHDGSHERTEEIYEMLAKLDDLIIEKNPRTCIERSSSERLF